MAPDEVLSFALDQRSLNDFAKGAAYYRAGQYAKATEALKRRADMLQSIDSDDVHYELAISLFVEAMARQRLREAPSAKKLLREAIVHHDEIFKHYIYWLNAANPNALRDEATALIQPEADDR